VSSKGKILKGTTGEERRKKLLKSIKNSVTLIKDFFPSLSFR